MKLFTCAALLVAPLVGCAETPSAPSGPALKVAVAPLTLAGVADACYGLAVYNVDKASIGPSSLVWSEASICADQYGDGRGSISYVGTCDAETDGMINTVSLVLNGLCSSNGCDVTDDGDPATIESTTYVNPCPATAPCLLERPCSENEDTLVEFNLTIMRDANQGFFDVAVNFEDVFCSAKLDCVPELLHRPGGDRDLTAVLGFACTSGSASTCLYTTSVTVDCGGTNVWTVDPSQGPGNITEGSPLLYGAAVYTGDEGFTAFKKSYWNVALGLDETLFATYPNCTLTWTGTASEAALDGTGPFTTPAGTTYPVVSWERDIIVDGQLACTQHPLNGVVAGETTPSVATEYTAVDAPASFAYTNCEPTVAQCLCPDGFTANPAGDGCSQVVTQAATSQTTTYSVCAGSSDGSYSGVGTRFSTSLEPGDFEVPPNDQPSLTCTDPSTCITDAALGVGYLSQVGVWACPPGSQEPTGSFVGFSECLDIQSAGEYLVGIAGDNHVLLRLDGATIYQSASPYNFRSWNILRVPVSSGQHIMELYGMNDGGPAAFGAEIWGPFPAGSLSTPVAMRDAYLAALAEVGLPKRIFSTEPMRTADPSVSFDSSLDGTSGWSCPTGFALDLCDPTPSCTQRTEVACEVAP